MARDSYRYFRIEARELVDQIGQDLLELERTGNSGEVVARLLRLVHTLKGAARVVRLPDIADQAHAMESLLAPLRDRDTPAARSQIEELLRLLDGVGAGLVQIAAPAAAPATAAPAASAQSAAPAVEDFHGGMDMAEIDRVLDGLTQTYAQIDTLGDIARTAGRVRRLSEQIDEQLAMGAGDAGGPALPGLGESARTLRTLAGDIERGLVTAQQRADREIRQARDGVEGLRLLPASAMLAGLDRASRDAARALGREVAFESEGSDIRLDAQVARLANRALVQLVRNALAHGIESPAERLNAGKPAQGRVSVSVLRRGQRIVLRCEDDGRGVDVEGLRQAASQRGRPAPVRDGDPEALADLLLHGGASTSATVSEVAGRGIGMDIVREAVAQLGAGFSVTTTRGRGTRFELSIPHSLSAIEGLVAESGGTSVAIPLHAVRETVRLGPDDIRAAADGQTIIHAGQAIPLVAMTRALGRPAAPGLAGQRSAVVVAGAGGLVAVAIGRLQGTATLVLRQMPALAALTPVIGGAALDAAGRPLLVLDPDGLVALARAGKGVVDAAPAPRRSVLVVDDSLTTRMLEQSILESAGYDVDLAVSGEEGLERARRGLYALVLVDVEMPGMDGFTFIEHIRHDQKLRDIPAILVTSRNSPEDKRRGEEVGAQGYVVKSEFDQGELLERIRQLVA